MNIPSADTTEERSHLSHGDSAAPPSATSARRQTPPSSTSASSSPGRAAPVARGHGRRYLPAVCISAWQSGQPDFLSSRATTAESSEGHAHGHTGRIRGPCW